MVAIYIAYVSIPVGTDVTLVIALTGFRLSATTRDFSRLKLPDLPRMRPSRLFSGCRGRFRRDKEGMCR